MTTIGIYYGKSQLCFRIQCIVHTVLVSHTKTFAYKTYSKRALSVQHNISYRFIVQSQLQTSYSSAGCLIKGTEFRISSSVIDHQWNFIISSLILQHRMNFIISTMKYCSHSSYSKPRRRIKYNTHFCDLQIKRIK